MVGSMLLPSEVEAKAILPALRALVAKKLVQKHKMPQQKVASLLGVTQAAVSNYLRETRAISFVLEDTGDVKRVTDEIVELLIKGTDSMLVRSKFQEASNILKKRRIICSAHEVLEPTIDVDSCHICNQFK